VLKGTAATATQGESSLGMFPELNMKQLSWQSPVTPIWQSPVTPISIESDYHGGRDKDVMGITKTRFVIDSPHKNSLKCDGHHSVPSPPLVA
jgi:hypothetical protein